MPTHCTINGCTNKAYGNHVCATHRDRMKKTGSYAAPDNWRGPNPLRPEIERLYIEEKLLPAAIAPLLGVTRNVVIGIINRGRIRGNIPMTINGITARVRYVNEAETPNLQPSRRYQRFWSRIMRKPDYIRTHDKFPERGCCLWMDGDPKDPHSFFCGEPGDPWCPKHRKRVYIKLEDLEWPTKNNARANGAALYAND